MNVVDSSGWLEYFANGVNADFFAPVIEDTEHLLVSVINIYEVFKKILQNQGLAMAEIRTTDLLKGKLVEVTAPLAMSAAVISSKLRLPMADSLILATTREFGAQLWTQDEHFKDLPEVKYIQKC